MLENIQIINFNRANLNLVMIRKIASMNKNDFESNEEGEESSSKIIWNLGFILNNILC